MSPLANVLMERLDALMREARPAWSLAELRAVADFVTDCDAVRTPEMQRQLLALDPLAPFRIAYAVAEGSK